MAAALGVTTNAANSKLDIHWIMIKNVLFNYCPDHPWMTTLVPEPVY